MKLSEIEQQVELIIGKDDPHDALRFARKLENAVDKHNIRQQDEEAYKELTQLIFALYVFSLTIAPDEVVEKVLTFNVLEALQLDFGEGRNLFERLDVRFLVFSFEAKEEQLSRLVPYLKQNEQYLGTSQLPIAGEQYDPMVKNWLEYYDQEAGLEGHSAFDRAEFISSDRVVNTLSNYNKELLRSLCKLYDFLQGEMEEQNVYEVSTTEEPPPETEEPPFDEEDESGAQDTSVTEQVETTETVNLQNMPSPQEKSSSGGTIDLRDIAEQNNQEK